jgi:predicted nucleic acid-binding protein
VNFVLDSGGVTALAGQRARLAELRRRGIWPPHVPAVVLVEVLTGDHRRDFHENHLLRMSQIHPIDEQTARSAARMRTETGRADEISATDAIVAAFAVNLRDSVIATSDPTDLTDLVETQSVPVTVSAV